MRKMVLVVASLLFLVCMPLASKAAVNVSIGIALPPLVFSAPPDVVVVPSGTSYVYMAPDAPGVYFYHNYWYRFYDGYWYRSSIYNGPWDYVDIALVPRVVVGVPPDYVHYAPRGYHRIRYHDLHNHWRSWDRQRHWHRYDWYKHGARDYRHYGDRHRGDRIHRDGRGTHGDRYRDRIHRDGRGTRGDKIHRDGRGTRGDGRRGDRIHRDGRGTRGDGHRGDGGRTRGDGRRGDGGRTHGDGRR